MMKKRSSYDKFGLDAVNNGADNLPGFGAMVKIHLIYDGIFGRGMPDLADQVLTERDKLKVL